MSKSVDPQIIFSFLSLQLNISGNTQALTVSDLVITEIQPLNARIFDQAFDQQLQITVSIEIADIATETDYWFRLADGMADEFPTFSVKFIVDEV